LQPDTNPINSQMAPFPLSFTMGASCSAISAVVSEAIVSSQKVLLKIALEKFLLYILSIVKGGLK